MSRPYLQYGIKQLEKLLQSSLNDMSVLAMLSEELQHRTTERAAHLEVKVNKRIEELRAHDRADRQSTHRSSDKKWAEMNAELVKTKRELENLVHELQSSNGARERCAAEKQSVTRKLGLAQAEISQLRNELRRAQNQSTRGNGAASGLGALEDLPIAAIRALRKTVTKSLHPDAVKDIDKIAAHERFVRFQQIFDAVESRKG